VGLGGFGRTSLCGACARSSGQPISITVSKAVATLVFFVVFIELIWLFFCMTGSSAWILAQSLRSTHETCQTLHLSTDGTRPTEKEQFGEENTQQDQGIFNGSANDYPNG